MKLCHPDPQVGRLQQVLHLFRVRIESGTVDVDVGREHAVDDGAEGAGNDLRVPRLAHGLVQEPRGSFEDRWKGFFALGCKVSRHLPRLAPVVGLLDVHRRRPEGLECDDQVGHVELGLQVELNRHVLHSVLRLPPRPVLVGLNLTRRLKPVYDVVDPVRRPRIISQSLRGRVTPEAFLSVQGLVQVGQNTVALLTLGPARRRGRELVLSSNEEVSGGRITTPLVATSAHRSVALLKSAAGNSKVLVGKTVKPDT